MTQLDLTGYTAVYSVPMDGPQDLQQLATSYYPWGGNTLESNGDQQHARDSQISFSAGNMVLTMEQDSGGQWWSGLVTTAGHYAMTTGYFEVRAALSSGPGSLSAVWMLQDTYPEIDLAEQPNLMPGAVWQGASYDGGAQSYHAWQYPPGGIDGFHTYGALIDASGVTLFIDRQSTVHMPAVVNMPHDMYGIVNLMTDAWSGLPPQGARPQMFIDSITAYEFHPQTLSLAMHADGPGHADVMLDGQWLFGVDVGQQQDFTFYRDIMAGPHTVTVMEAPGATLSVDGIAIGSVFHTEARAPIGGGGYHDFQI